MENLYGLIMAGGSGTRLWPVSRDYYPKQFLQLFGDKTLIQQTFVRLKRIIRSENIFVLTDRASVEEVINQLDEYGLTKKNIVIQPAVKNTGPANIFASLKIQERDNDAIIISCPSDHVILPESKFVNTVKTGYQLAKRGLLVTLGIKPAYANPEYGYIIRDESQTDVLNHQTVFKVKSFIEKPDEKIAAQLIKKGAFWNSGIFIWSAKSIIKEVRNLNPKMLASVQNVKRYHNGNSISIDEGVIEKSNLVWVVPTNFEWNDIGSWKALYNQLPKDNNLNVINNATVLNCKRSLIYGSAGRKLTAINLNDMVVVDTDDSVLVSARESVHEIKKTLEKGYQKPLVTIIVPTLNDEKYLEDSLASIFEQSYKNIECIIVDGGSTDSTTNIVDKYSHRIEQVIDLHTSNRFERINRGLDSANGEIIGILDPNNTYFDRDVISTIIDQIEKTKSDMIWGDLVYVENKNDNKITMYWKSSGYQTGILEKGWTPPFPTLFTRKTIYEKYGSYNTRFRVAADYEMILKLLRKHDIRTTHIPRIIVKMVGRGLSWKSMIDRLIGNFETYKAWGINKLRVSPSFLLLKNISKLGQFFSKVAKANN